MSAKQGEITSFFQNKKANDDGDEISTSTDLLSNNLNEAQDQTALCAEISSLELSMTSTSALLTYLNLTPKTYTARDGLPWNPSMYASTLLQDINARSVSALRLVSFFKQIPEFNQLNAQDRFTLIKYNLMAVLVLNSTLSYNTETNSIMETDSDAPWNSTILAKVHGDEIYRRVKKVFDSFARIAQYDQRIIQLALIVFILTKGFSTNGSTSEPILDDSMAVYRAQKYYTELLWKYLQTIHGNGKAIHIFKELVAHFISWQTLQEYPSRSLPNVLIATDMNELLPIMKSLLQIS